MKNKTAAISVIIVLSVILQLMVAPNIVIAGVGPNFLMLAIFMVALIDGSTTGSIVGFILGFLIDLIGSGPIGPMALIGTVLGFLVGTIRNNISTTSWITPLIVFALSSFLADFSYTLLLKVLGTDMSLWTAFVYKVLPGTLYNTAIGLAFFPLLNRLLRDDSSSFMTVSKRF